MAVSVFVGDRVLVPTDTEGLSGTYALGTTAVQGYLTPANAGVSSGSYVAYTVVDSLENPTQFEIGEGVFTAGSPSTIARTVTIRNHTGGTGKVNWGAGTKYLFLAPSAAKFIMYDSDGNFSLSTPLTIGSGTVSNTALSPINDRDTGPYFSGENKFAIAAGGSRVFEATTTSTTIYSPLTAASGLVVGPGGTFSVSSTAIFSAISRFGSTVDAPGSGNTNTGSTINPNGSSHFSVSSGDYAILVNRNDTEGVGITFNKSGSQIGFVYVSTSVRYATSSDYRLKENFEEFTEAQDFVDATPVYKFNWKEKPNAPKIFGFKAHEVQHLIPQAVIGEKDGEDMQAIDHSQLVPVLWGAVQSLSQKVSLLENQINTLTNSS
jgi:hypothetical protein